MKPSHQSMFSRHFPFWFALAVVDCVQGLLTNVSPIHKVLQMLEDMKTKGLKEMEVEKMVFKDYTDFVKGRRAELADEIAAGKASGEQLSATIGKAESDVQVYTGNIADLASQVVTLEASRQSAIDMREADNAKFEEEQTDYSETLYALDRAIQIIKAQSYDRQQAMMMLQQTATSTKAMHRVLAALALVQEGDLSSLRQPDGAPDVAAYEFQSGNIVETLEQLQKRFTEELGELQKEEINAAHAHSMEVQHLDHVLANLKAKKEDRTASKAKAVETAAISKEDLANVKAMVSDAEKFLSDLNSTYESKLTTFEANQKVREEEIVAITNAVQILSSPETVGSYEKHVKTLIQVPPMRKATSFLQIRTNSSRSLLEQTAARYLRHRAIALDSKHLSTISSQIRDSPFDKVVEMIETLLSRLQEEAASEADHKSYCDEELQKNKLKRDDLGSTIARLRIEADAKAAAVSSMDSKIAVLSEQQATLRKVLSDASATRTKEKEANLEAIHDSKEAQVALKEAIAVLEEFYEKQGTFFIQARQTPELLPYNGMLGEKGGVIGMLQVIESDFARVEADTRAAEDQAAEEYATLVSDTEEDIKLKHDSEFKLSLKKDQADFEREQLEKDFEAASKQLEMAQTYYEELKPQCIEVQVSYEERVARRKEEIEALQQAYKILNGESTA